MCACRRLTNQQPKVTLFLGCVLRCCQLRAPYYPQGRARPPPRGSRPVQHADESRRALGRKVTSASSPTNERWASPRLRRDPAQRTVIGEGSSLRRLLHPAPRLHHLFPRTDLRGVRVCNGTGPKLGRRPFPTASPHHMHMHIHTRVYGVLPTRSRKLKEQNAKCATFAPSVRTHPIERGSSRHAR